MRNLIFESCVITIVIWLAAFTWQHTHACDFLIEKTIRENSGRSEILVNVTEELILRKKITLEELKHTVIHLRDAEDSRPFVLYKGLLKTGKVVDRESICRSHDKVQNKIIKSCCNQKCCKFISIAGLAQSYYIKVIIEDENDMAPKFKEGIDGVFKISLQENTGVGERIRLPIAIDEDSEKNAVKNYEIQSPSAQFTTYFKLNFQQKLNSYPKLYLKKSVDRETIDNFHFNLVATDGNNTGSLLIQVKIIDVNDHKPKFDKSKYNYVIKENDKINVEIQCRDPDDLTNGNGRITYKIKNQVGPAMHYFQVNPKSHGVQLEQTAAIDYETIQDMEFLIIASDSGEPQKSSTASIEIRVRNVNDHDPEITFYNIGVSLDTYHARLDLREGFWKQQIICYVHVTDRDTDLQDINCEVNQPKNRFHLTEEPSMLPVEKQKIYKLITMEDFDREQQISYRVTVQCEGGKSGDKRSSENTLKIKVQDVNDNKPVFKKPKYFGKVRENMVNSIVSMGEYNIQAIDLDEGENAKIRYSLAGTEIRSNRLPFSIDIWTGEMRTTQKLDYENQNNYTFMVIATDMGYNPLNASVPVIVNVIDTNDNPPIVEHSHYIFNVEEGLPPRTTVGKIVAIDADTKPGNKDVIFTLPNNFNDPSSQYFAIESNTGIIKTKKELDRESSFNQFHFTVTASNRNSDESFEKSFHGGLTTEVTVTVRVVDRNDNAPKLRSRSGLRPGMHTDIVFIKETFDEHNPCVDFPLEFHDEDEGINAEVDVQLDSKSFVLDMDHRMICVKDKLPPVGRYSLLVQATDKGVNVTKSSEFPISVQVKSDPTRKLEPIGDNHAVNPSFDNESRNITIIAVLVSVAGVFCLILLAIVIALKRCPPHFKAYDDKDEEGRHTSPEMRYSESKLCQSKSCDTVGRIHETRNLICEDDVFCDGVTTLRRYGDHWVATTLGRDKSGNVSGGGGGSTFCTPGMARRPNLILDGTKSLSRSCEQLRKNLNLDGPDTGGDVGAVGAASGDKFSDSDSSPPGGGYQVIDPMVSMGPLSQNQNYYYLKNDQESWGGSGEGSVPRNIVVNSICSAVGDDKNNTKKKSLKNVYFQTSFV